MGKNSKDYIPSDKYQLEAWAKQFNIVGAEIHHDTDTRSPYVDNQQMENGTQYYAYFILGDTEVGQQSDVGTEGV